MPAKDDSAPADPSDPYAKYWQMSEEEAQLAYMADRYGGVDEIAYLLWQDLRELKRKKAAGEHVPEVSLFTPIDEEDARQLESNEKAKELWEKGSYPVSVWFDKDPYQRIKDIDRARAKKAEKAEKRRAQKEKKRATQAQNPQPDEGVHSPASSPGPSTGA